MVFNRWECLIEKGRLLDHERYRAFSITWPASMQMYWNKRKRLHKKRVQLPQDCLRTPIWLPWRHVKRSVFTLLTTRKIFVGGLGLLRRWKVISSPLSGRQTMESALAMRPKNTTAWFQLRDGDVFQHIPRVRRTWIERTLLLFEIFQ